MADEGDGLSESVLQATLSATSSVLFSTDQQAYQPFPLQLMPGNSGQPAPRNLMPRLPANQTVVNPGIVRLVNPAQLQASQIQFMPTGNRVFAVQPGSQRVMLQGPRVPYSAMYPQAVQLVQGQQHISRQAIPVQPNIQTREPAQVNTQPPVPLRVNNAELITLSDSPTPAEEDPTREDVADMPVLDRQDEPQGSVSPEIADENERIRLSCFLIEAMEHKKNREISIVARHRTSDGIILEADEPFTTETMSSADEENRSIDVIEISDSEGESIIDEEEIVVVEEKEEEEPMEEEEKEEDEEEEEEEYVPPRRQPKKEEKKPGRRGRPPGQRNKSRLSSNKDEEEQAREETETPTEKKRKRRIREAEKLLAMDFGPKAGERILPENRRRSGAPVHDNYTTEDSEVSDFSEYKQIDKRQTTPKLERMKNCATCGEEIKKHNWRRPQWCSTYCRTNSTEKKKKDGDETEVSNSDDSQTEESKGEDRTDDQESEKGIELIPEESIEFPRQERKWSSTTTGVEGEGVASYLPRRRDISISYTLEALPGCLNPSKLKRSNKEDEKKKTRTSQEGLQQTRDTPEPTKQEKCLDIVQPSPISFGKTKSSLDQRPTQKMRSPAPLQKRPPPPSVDNLHPPSQKQRLLAPSVSNQLHISLLPITTSQLVENNTPGSPQFTSVTQQPINEKNIKREEEPQSSLTELVSEPIGEPMYWNVSAAHAFVGEFSEEMAEVIKRYELDGFVLAFGKEPLNQVRKTAMKLPDGRPIPYGPWNHVFSDIARLQTKTLAAICEEPLWKVPTTDSEITQWIAKVCSEKAGKNLQFHHISLCSLLKATVQELVAYTGLSYGEAIKITEIVRMNVLNNSWPTNNISEQISTMVKTYSKTEEYPTWIQMFIDQKTFDTLTKQKITVDILHSIDIAELMKYANIRYGPAKILDYVMEIAKNESSVLQNISFDTKGVTLRRLLESKEEFHVWLREILDEEYTKKLIDVDIDVPLLFRLTIDDLLIDFNLLYGDAKRLLLHIKALKHEKESELTKDKGSCIPDKFKGNNETIKSSDISVWVSSFGTAEDTQKIKTCDFDGRTLALLDTKTLLGLGFKYSTAKRLTNCVKEACWKYEVTVPNNFYKMKDDEYIKWIEEITNKESKKILIDEQEVSNKCLRFVTFEELSSMLSFGPALGLFQYIKILAERELETFYIYKGSPKTWDEDDVFQWVSSFCSSEVAAILKDNKIDGANLCDLQADEYKTEFGFKFGPIKAISSCFQKLNQRHNTPVTHS